MAGMIGRRSARPRLSPSAMSAICWAAMAGSHEVRVAKMAPARAVLDRGDGLEMVRPFGRFWMERREVQVVVVGSFVVGLDGLWVLGVVKHLALSMAIVAIVAANCATFSDENLVFSRQNCFSL